MSDLTVKQRMGTDLLDLKQEFEHIFHHMFNHHFYPAGSAEALVPVIPPIETWIDTADKEFHLTMPLPGIKPEALNVTLQGNRLTFSGEQKDEEKEDKPTKNYLQREFSYQQFMRTITLPNGVEGEKMTAELKDGLLEITAPIAASALPKKIEIKNAVVASAAKAAGK